MNDAAQIDFVVLWVDDKDPVWREKKEKYTGTTMKEGNTEVRYRDWDTLRYWFRGVEKFAPWVRYVYFVTDDQKPEWLNMNHPKLKWVRHTDFIPAEYLPTFNSNAIDWNLYRIEGLSEQFVYFNDDIFLIDKTEPEDFFINGLPCDAPKISITYPLGFFEHILFNNTEILNRYFSLRNSIRDNFSNWIKTQSLKGLLSMLLYGRKDFIPGSASNHIHVNYQKSTFEELWKREGVKIDETCRNRLRTENDISHWCVRDWQLFTGQFYPRKPIGKMFHTASMCYNNKAIDYLRKQKGKVICLNDSENETDFERHKKMILEAFEMIMPEKSSFEK